MNGPMTLDLSQLLAPFIERVERLEAKIAELDNRPQLDPKELITVGQAAAEAQISPAAVYKLIERGKVQRHHVGGTRRFLVRRGDVLGGA